MYCAACTSPLVPGFVLVEQPVVGKHDSVCLKVAIHAKRFCYAVPSYGTHHLVQAPLVVMPDRRKHLVLPAIRQISVHGMTHDAYGASQSYGNVRFVLAVDKTLAFVLALVWQEFHYPSYGQWLRYDVLHVVGAEHVAESDEVPIHGMLYPKFRSIFSP